MMIRCVGLWCTLFHVLKKGIFCKIINKSPYTDLKEMCKMKKKANGKTPLRSHK